MAEQAREGDQAMTHEYTDDKMYPYEVYDQSGRRRGKFTSWTDAKDFARSMLLINDGEFTVDVVGPDPETDLNTIRIWRIKTTASNPDAMTSTTKKAG